MPSDARRAERQFMESLDDSSIAHWGHERRRLARSPGFSRPAVLPPGGWTPCKSRFMESLDLQLWTHIGTMNLVGAPDSDPARREVVSIEPHRSAALRFMERRVRILCAPCAP